MFWQLLNVLTVFHLKRNEDNNGPMLFQQKPFPIFLSLFIQTLIDFRSHLQLPFHCFLKREARPANKTQTKYFFNSFADQNVLYCLIGFLSPTAAALVRKWWNCHVVMVTYVSYFFLFSLYFFLLEDERPNGEDYPEWLHHNLWLDPDWNNPLPEAPQTRGPGEADGLYINGRPHTWCSYLQDSTKDLWPTSPILRILIEVTG